jgi:hypothetical protein
LEIEREPSSPSQSSLLPVVLLGILFSWLAFIASKCDQSREPVRPQDSAEGENPDVSRQSTFVANPVPSKPNANSSDGGKQRTPLWEKLVALGTIGLLVANICQSCATFKAADAAKTSADTAFASIRPWIEFYNPSNEESDPSRQHRFANSVVGGEPIDFPVNLTNSGKTPARQVRADIFIAIVPAFQSPPLDWVEHGVDHNHHALMTIPNTLPEGPCSTSWPGWIGKGFG